jgi:hypothetical protein
MINETESLVGALVDAAQTPAFSMASDNVPSTAAIDGENDVDATIIGVDANHNTGFNRDLEDVEGSGGIENVATAIEAAEEVRDPLDGLVERTRTDAGAPFRREAVDALAGLKEQDRAAFESLRQNLKRAGCRVTQLDQEISAENGLRGIAPADGEELRHVAN